MTKLTLAMASIFGCLAMPFVYAGLSSGPVVRAQPLSAGKPMVVHARRGPQPESLKEMLMWTPIVVSGKVKRVIREAHTPYNSDGPLQHTLFEFVVDREFKDEKGEVGATIKVRIEQGNLPWTFQSRHGVGFRIDGDPMLQPGARYVLFLMRLAQGVPNGEEAKAAFGGMVGKGGDRDEFGPVPAWQGVIALDGVAERPEDADGRPVAQWSFREGPQILGLSESAAIKLIQSELAKARREDPRR